MNMIIRRRPTSLNNFERFVDDFWRNAEGLLENNTDGQALALDVHENDTAYTVVTALPGVNADDIDIRFHDDVLTVSAEINEATSEENARWLMRERRYGKFSRSLRLPVQINADAIEANYENGVLTLSVPKAEEVQPRSIKVKAASK